MAVEGVALVYMVVVVFLAAVVRGYSGFGFSALVVVSLSLVLAPAQVVPVLLLLEVAASVVMLPGVWRHIAWRRLGRLVAGQAPSIPVGVYLLASVPEAPMRLAISLLVLVATIALWRGAGPRSGIGSWGQFGTGVVSGAMNGAAGIGGLVVAVMLLSSFVEMTVARATLVALFFATDIYTYAVVGMNGLLSVELVLTTILMLVPLFLGIRLGRSWFSRATEASFRRFVLGLLMALSLAGIGRGMTGMGWL